MKMLSNFNLFKREINLTQYAANIGYEIDKKKSTRNSIVMRKRHEDKIVISRRNGHWLYFSVYDDTDKGSIVDFLQNRTAKSLPEIAVELEQWLDGTIPANPHIQYFNSVEEKKADPERIKRLFSRCTPVRAHPYLEGRGIRPSILSAPRFQGTVYGDYYQNAVFPHFKNNKVSGLEFGKFGVTDHLNTV